MIRYDMVVSTFRFYIELLKLLGKSNQAVNVAVYAYEH